MHHLKYIPLSPFPPQRSTLQPTMLDCVVQQRPCSLHRNKFSGLFIYHRHYMYILGSQKNRYGILLHCLEIVGDHTIKYKESMHVFKGGDA